MFEINIYQSALEVGGCIAVLLILGLLITRICQHIYAWLDDSKVAKRNVFVVKLNSLWGYEPPESWGFYKIKKGGSTMNSGEAGPLLSALVCGLLPLLVVLALHHIFFTLTVLGFIAAAHLARFCLRHKKLFDKHLTDKEAHK